MQVTSRCGIDCTVCEYREKMNCQGCVAIKNPFWGGCPVKACAEAKGVTHCGQCSVFPCGLLISFAYDKAQGDSGQRIERCRQWQAAEKNQVV